VGGSLSSSPFDRFFFAPATSFFALLNTIVRPGKEMICNHLRWGQLLAIRSREVRGFPRMRQRQIRRMDGARRYRGHSASSTGSELVFGPVNFGFEVSHPCCDEAATWMGHPAPAVGPTARYPLAGGSRYPTHATKTNTSHGWGTQRCRGHSASSTGSELVFGPVNFGVEVSHPCRDEAATWMVPCTLHKQ
jgi:hypothetical protein